MRDMIEVGILGADGRMGLAVAEALVGHESAQLSVAITAASCPNLGQQVPGHKTVYSDDLTAGLSCCDVLIDFSAPTATLAAATALPNATCRALVSGTTGLTAQDEGVIAEAAKFAPILRSGNFSLGITLLEVLTEKAARALNEGWDIEITDVHHRHKVDAPSGTAIMLGRAAAKGRRVNLDDKQVLSREGQTGERKAGEIGFTALRSGGVIGDHDVRIASELEMITLSHRAFDRSVFAQGAVTAALWAAGQPEGLYSMRDVLGL